MENTGQLTEIKTKLENGEQVPRVSVREFLSWFGAQRRGVWIVSRIRDGLSEAGLETEPDFESAYIDSTIGFTLPAEVEVDAEQAPAATILSAELSATATVSASLSVSPSVASVYADPTYRISKLEAANRHPVSIPPDAELKEAATLMLSKDFSQLPVMTSERDVKGVVSWSSIATRLALGKTGQYVREFMESHKEVEAEASLFQAIPIISELHYVLIRAKDRRISGIVTATDLSLQFEQLSEPFLLLGEIENHIRRIIGKKLSVEELQAAKDQGDDERTVERVADLTFGEYIRLMENPDRWAKIGLPIDRAEFCKQLEKVRRIRNDVMHFDPDGVPPDEKKILRDFAAFLRKLQALDVS